MPAVLNTNAASLYASKNLQSAQSKMAQSVERLSSGLRINRAKDDAAGLGITNALTSQINGANQGIRNLNDGISMVQTAEGAIAAAQEMAQRILTLATQGANGTMGTNERAAIKSEMTQLLTAIDSIGSRTMFSGISLLNNEARTDATTATAPTTEKFSIQASNNTTDTLSLKAGGFLNIGGFSGAASVIATKTTGATSATGQAVLTLPNITGLVVGMFVSGGGVATGAVITALTSSTSVTLSDNTTGQVAADAVITFGNSTSTTRSTVLQLASGSNPPQSVIGTTVYKVNSSMVYTKIGTVTGVSGNNITLGTTSAAVTWADADEIVFSGQLTQVHSATSTDKTLHQAVRQLDSSDATKYQMAQRSAEGYVKALTTQRSLLGAYQNQIEYTVSNVTELSANRDAARSNVQDTDYASETATLTKGQILQQAATAMLAQANQMPNVILSLLK